MAFRRRLEYRGFRPSYPDVARWRGSVIPAILPHVIFVASVAALVTIAYVIYGASISLATSVIPGLSMVIGLILAFRTNTAYDRFWEGRKLWGTLDTNVRNMARLVWVGVSEKGTKDTKEKIACISMLLAYVVAVKRHLRGQWGVDFYDLKTLLPRDFHPCAATEACVVRVLPTKGRSKGDGRNAQLSHEDWTVSERADDGAMCLPLEISFQISLWIAQENRQGNIDPAIVGPLTASLNAMVDVFGSLERILLTPIPLAYNIHLKQVVFLYLCVLPFTLVKDLGWWTIPLTTLVAFTLFGIEGIGNEIENPFGEDANDLRLDQFCADLKAELDYIVKNIPTATKHVFIDGN